METLVWLVGGLQTILTATLVLAITVIGLIRLKQLPYYKQLMAFPHEYESIPLIRHLNIHISLLRKESQTGVPYGVHFFKFICEKVEHFREQGCFSLFIGAEPNLVIFRADHMEKLLTSSTNISKGYTYSFIHPWLGQGLLTSSGAKWKSRRRLLTPAFHFRILDQFSVIMNQQAKIFMDRMGTKKPEEDIVPFITAVTLDIVCETIMGVAMNSQTTGSGQKYLKSIKGLGERILERIQSPSQWVEFLYQFTQAGRANARDLKELHAFSLEVINERKSELEANPDELERMAATSADDDSPAKLQKPFLDLLLVEHLIRKTMTVSDIREEVDTFMFEGHDTTSMGLTWAIYQFGLYPEVQKKIQKEIDDIFHGDTEAEVSAEHVKQMKYFDMALKETQRLMPSVPLISRTITDDLKVDGKPVPIGTEITCHIYGLHRDPKVFPDPLKFDPDRFLPENTNGRSPFAFVPFSAGPRNCIGQRFALLEEKIILVWLLRKYNLKSLDPFEKINLVAEMVLVPKCPIRVECTPRE